MRVFVWLPWWLAIPLALFELLIRLVIYAAIGLGLLLMILVRGISALVASRQQTAPLQPQRAAQQQVRAEQPVAPWQAPWERPAAQREADRQLGTERRAVRQPMGWPGRGNIAAGVAALAGLVLAGVAGSDANSPLVAVAGLLFLLAAGLAAVCVPVGIYRKVRMHSGRGRGRGTITPGFEAAHGLIPPQDGPQGHRRGGAHRR